MKRYWQNIEYSFINIGKVFVTTLAFRIVAVILVILTLPIRPTLPLWMLDWFQRISYPLILYNLALLLFHKKTAALIKNYPSLLFTDLGIAIGILLIGGSWRSSYFGYTFSTIILFTIYKGRPGAYISAAALSLVALLKDPTGGLPSLQVFYVNDWDMRMGACLIYITAGLILGYFSALLQKMEALSKARLEETRKLAAVEEKTRLALELHDGAKQMVNAMLLMMNPLAKGAGDSRDENSGELLWLWRGMHYLQSELNQVMDALKQEEPARESRCSILEIAREEIRIAEGMTGFSWNLITPHADMDIPAQGKLPLRKFFSEALMNAWKHSGAAAGSIELAHAGEFFTIRIKDNGKGFTCTEKSIEQTTGLKSLRYRADELNGHLAIETAAGNGCTLVLSLPVCNELAQTEEEQSKKLVINY